MSRPRSTRSRWLSLALLPLTMAFAPGLAATTWDDAVSAYRAGDYARTSELLLPLAESNPDHAGTHLLLGRSLLALDRSGEAVRWLEAAVRLDPEDPSAQLSLATAQVNLGAADDAVRTLATIDPATLDAAHARNAAALAVGLVAAAEDPDAVADVLLALRTAHPDQAMVAAAHATALGNLDRRLEAVAAWLDAWTAAPSEDAYRRRALTVATAWAESSEDPQAWPQSARVFEQAAGAVNLAVGWRTTGQLWAQAREWRRAEQAFAAALELDPGDGRALLGWARVIRCLDRSDDAGAALQEALTQATDPELVRALHAELALLAESRLELEAAVEHHRRAGHSARADEIAEVATATAEAQSTRQDLEQRIADLERSATEL